MLLSYDYTNLTSELDYEGILSWFVFCNFPNSDDMPEFFRSSGDIYSWSKSCWISSHLPMQEIDLGSPKWHKISEQYNPKIRYETGPGLTFDLIRPYSRSEMALFQLHQSIKWKVVGHF